MENVRDSVVTEGETTAHRMTDVETTAEITVSVHRKTEETENVRDSVAIEITGTGIRDVLADLARGRKESLLCQRRS